MKGARTIFILGIFLLGLSGQNLLAQESEDYPNKPVTLLGAYPAGGSTDSVSRVFSSVALKHFKQPVITTPKPGGSGMVALQSLASSKPDGYTLIMGRVGELVIAPLIEKMPFDTEKDFVPVGMVGQGRVVFSVHSKSPWVSIEELIAAAKKDPGKIKYASAGLQTVPRLLFEKFCQDVGIKLTCVPFKGAAPAGIAAAGGHLPVFPAGVSETLNHVQRGDLRVLLSCSEKRLKQYPDAPTAKEKGYNVNFGVWYTVFAPRGIPPAVISKLEGLVKKVAEDKEFIAAMDNIGEEPDFLSAKDFAESLAKDRIWIAETVKRLYKSDNP